MMLGDIEPTGQEVMTLTRMPDGSGQMAPHLPTSTGMMVGVKDLCSMGQIYTTDSNLNAKCFNYCGNIILAEGMSILSGISGIHVKVKQGSNV